MKRVILFLAVNLAVIFLLTIAVNVLLSFAGPELRESMCRGGIDMFSLGVFSLVFGMGGAFISLLISKPMAKWSVGAQVVDGSESEETRWLVATVDRLSRAANIKMPEVAIYRGAPNAFATGAFKNSALVAVSDQIMASMDRSELEAVLGHEISHVANGDMVTLTLVQGVLNAVVLFLSRIIAYAVDNAMSGKDNRRGSSGMYFIVMYVMQMLLGVLASLIVFAYSRRREYAADAGSARLLGTPGPMINALRRLAGGDAALPQSLQAFGIKGRSSTSIWSTHPSTEDRIAALERIRAGI
jgi:heat shock protein HtpX